MYPTPSISLGFFQRVKMTKVDLDKININGNNWSFKTDGDNIACFDGNGELVSMVYVLNEHLLSISYFPPKEWEFVGDYHFYLEDVVESPHALISYIEYVIAQYRASLWEE